MTATEQELKVAEKAREHHVEIVEEIEVEKQRVAELRNQVQTVKKSLEEQQHKTDYVRKGVTQKPIGAAENRCRSFKESGRQRRIPKNENMRWRLRSRRL